MKAQNLLIIVHYTIFWSLNLLKICHVVLNGVSVDRLIMGDLSISLISCQVDQARVIFQVH